LGVSAAGIEDRFLGGRVLAVQPQAGFRAGHDTVLLAAAVPATGDERVLELGSGAGIASLCLARRVEGVRILGVEADAALARLANDNAARNAMAERVRFIAGDVAGFAESGFDHVFFNPPFHPASGQRSRDAARDRAMRDTDNAIAAWTKAALARVKAGGTVTAILRADRGAEMLAAASGEGAIVFPLFPHAGEAPKRVIVRIVKGASTGLHTVKGLVLHQADGRNTDGAEAVLRHAAPLLFD
jgi:tRNA1(Val) A37 N6-methylase TrmN6